VNWRIIDGAASGEAVGVTPGNNLFSHQASEGVSTECQGISIPAFPTPIKESRMRTVRNLALAAAGALALASAALAQDVQKPEAKPEAKAESAGCHGASHRARHMQHEKHDRHGQEQKHGKQEKHDHS
jgi:hypothetical protein